MKPDLYTKAVLTVIAACLMTITLKSLIVIPTATASPGQPAGQPHYGVVPVNEDGSITIRMLPGEAMPVNIISIRKPFTSGEIARYSWDAVNVSK